jgi:hypothetical protein
MGFKKAEEPVELDRLTYAVYCHLQDYELWEESKRK